MNNRFTEEFFKKIEQNTASEQEGELFDAWFYQHKNENVKQYSALELEQIRDEMEKCLPKKDASKIMNVLNLIGIAAAMLLASGIAILFIFTFNNHSELIEKKNDVADILPGSNGAILTLGDGRKIDLKRYKKNSIKLAVGDIISKTVNGQIKYDDALNISHKGVPQNRRFEFNTLTTGYGQQYQLLLPDSTKVWLNAGSEITYPTSFASFKERKVHLSGEAYFEVRKDKSHPFIVESKFQIVKVLGTHFNVNSYPDENVTKTTLIEGSVRIMNNSIRSNSLRNQIVQLIPGQQGVSTSNSLFINHSVITDEVVAWKNGYFKFNGNLQSILNQIARWYNVEVVYQNKPDPLLTFQGEVSRNRNLNEILKILKYSGKVQLSLNGRRIMVQN